jgi:hypothetical protein
MSRPATSRPSPARYVHKLVMHGASPHPSVDVEEIDLRDRIAELEQLVATAPALERRRRESARHLVPADEELQPRARERRLTKLEKRALARERRRHILTSVLLVAALIGLLNLLAHLLRA